MFNYIIMIRKNHVKTNICNLSLSLSLSFQLFVLRSEEFMTNNISLV